MTRAYAGDERDQLRRRGGVLRAMAEVLDAAEELTGAFETLALELDRERHGSDSILADRDRADREQQQQ